MATAILLTFAAAACMGGDDAEGDAASTGGKAPGPAQSPTDLAAEPAAFSVRLSWTAPAGGPEIERYALYRDGAWLAFVPGSETGYSDDGVVPGEEYSYAIEARAGKTASGRTSVSVETHVPSLRAARLEGVFNVKTRITSQSGYSDYDVPIFGWRFTPSCKEGACNVRWNDLQTKRIHGKLTRHGARYRGSYTGYFYMECSGAHGTTSLEIDLKVVRARVVDDRWRATRLGGTIDQSEAAQLGCRPSHAELAVRARLAE
ncbi:MAG TPA: fibronectin type III domain-containing protein [Gaiellaceae bacterium]